MNHIEQIITANEELSAAIEHHAMVVKPFAFAGLSFAMEDAQEDVKQEAKQGVLEKIKAIISRVIAWFKSLIFKKKEDKLTMPVFDSEKFRKDMEESFKNTMAQARARSEKMSKDLDEALARAREFNSAEMQEKMRQNIAQKVEQQRKEESERLEREVPGSEKTKAHWKKFIEPNLPKYLQDAIRDKCGLLTALAKGGEISKDTVRFEDITAPIREFDNSLYTIVDSVRDTVREVMRNLNDPQRIEGFVGNIQEEIAEVTKFTGKLEALGDVQPVAPNIDSSSIHTIYRVVYDLSGKMPRSSIAGSVEILTEEMSKLEKTMDTVRTAEGMESNAAFKAVQDLITKVIVPATVQAQKCARIVSEVFYNFQEIGGLIAKHARNPNTMPSYKSFAEALRADFKITDEQQLHRIAMMACEIHGTNYLYPEANKG